MDDLFVMGVRGMLYVIGHSARVTQTNVCWRSVSFVPPMV